MIYKTKGKLVDSENEKEGSIQEQKLTFFMEELHFYDKALIEGKSIKAFHTTKTNAGSDMFTRLKKILQDSNKGVLMISEFYEKVYQILEQGSKAGILKLMLAWELHIIYVSLSEALLSISMTFA